MADIFLSYASEDRERIRSLVQALEARGLSVWWDRHIGLGTAFDREIERELKAARCVVTVWSKASVDSDWVREETQEGLDRKILVPIQIDDCQLPLGFRRMQTAQLINWPTNSLDLSELVDRIFELTGSVTPVRSDADVMEPVARKRRQIWPIAGAVLAVLIAAFLTQSLWLSGSSNLPVPPERWVQLTNFPDSAGQPALSPDGRVLAFVRGPSSFTTPGQIYSKRLPDGTPVALTQDSFNKMSPAFSPDGSRIAYTVVGGQFEWDTWRVEALGGNPGRWLSNASGLTWMNEETLLFSEIIPNEGVHMKIVAGPPTREGSRDIYVPEDFGGMAHRSTPSKDGQWILIVEMDYTTAFLPCRLIATHDPAASRQVGPPTGGCTFAAWSPDQEWMYFTSASTGANHIWRQRFPDGEPEQVTSGTTSEEGISVAPDGKSLVTAVALKKSSVWISDHGVERAISSEGLAFEPQFTPDGRRLFFRISQGIATGSDASELWFADLQTGHVGEFLPGFSLFGFNAYDISVHNEVVLSGRGPDGKAILWLAPVDRSLPPVILPNAQGDEPHFGADDEIFFRGADVDNRLHIYRIERDGRGLRKAVSTPIQHFGGVSPDGQWAIAFAQLESGQDLFTQAFPLDGGKALPLYGGGANSNSVTWTADGRFLLLDGGVTTGPLLEGAEETSLIPIPEGKMFPEIPPGGYQAATINEVPGYRVIASGGVSPGPALEIFAYTRQAVQRNLYRVPLP